MWKSSINCLSRHSWRNSQSEYDSLERSVFHLYFPSSFPHVHLISLSLQSDAFFRENTLGLWHWELCKGTAQAAGATEILSSRWQVFCHCCISGALDLFLDIYSGISKWSEIQWPFAGSSAWGLFSLFSQLWSKCCWHIWQVRLHCRWIWCDGTAAVWRDECVAISKAR